MRGERAAAAVFALLIVLGVTIAASAIAGLLVVVAYRFDGL